jgi:hypothetical protein
MNTPARYVETKPTTTPMHLHTTVKVRAAGEKEAIEEVNDLLTDNGEYHIDPFDWVADDETRISEDVKTEEDFLKLREMERNERIENLRRADEAQSENMKGFYIRKAGECLAEDNFWSTERLQFTIDWLEPKEGDRIFYVDTDRHY